MMTSISPAEAHSRGTISQGSARGWPARPGGPMGKEESDGAAELPPGGAGERPVGQLAAVALQTGPGVLTKPGFPFAVETGLAQTAAEAVGLDHIEDHARVAQGFLQSRVQ